MSGVSAVYQATKLNNVLQQSTSINNNNNNSQSLVINKNNQGINKDDILLTNTAKKKNIPRKDLVQKPAPIAVARRNARERNRVKQVNNGFANLRSHIPNSIAANFENSNGRGGSKKLSKVETLRMAVEYIRQLEDILASSQDSDNSSILNENELFNTSNNEFVDDKNQQRFIVEEKRFVKVLPMNFHFENTENLSPIDLELNNEIDINNLNLLNSMSNASLSPEMYSDESMSPQSYSSFQEVVFQNVTSPIMKFRIIPPEQPLDVKIEPVDVIQNVENVMEVNDFVQQHVKVEKDVDDGSKNNVVDVINWWNQQQHVTTHCLPEDGANS